MVVLGDDPYLLAEFTTILARRDSYLPLLDGPRLTRPDADAEVIRRTNTVARLQPRMVILAGLPGATSALIMERLPRTLGVSLDSTEQLLTSVKGLRHPSTELRWG